MTDRELLQQALNALETADEFDFWLKQESIVKTLRERLAHCDRCGKLHGGEGDIHTCSPRLDQGPDYERGFVDGMSRQAQSSVDRAVNRMAQPEQEPVHYGPSSSIFGLAEMILSDCGCSSDYQPLLNRVAERIQGYIDTPPAAPQPEQEPVAWGVFDGPNLHDMFYAEEDAKDMARLKGDGSVVKPLTTPPAAQRTWVGLTDEEVMNFYLFWVVDLQDIIGFYKAVDRKLKEKNNG